MGAIKKHYDIKIIMKQILLSEVDIALLCHKGPDIESAFEEILKVFASSRKLKLKGVESAGRIMNLKDKYLY
jgi:beta-N-acetylhexosaminidase